MTRLTKLLRVATIGSTFALACGSNDTNSGSGNNMGSGGSSGNATASAGSSASARGTNAGGSSMGTEAGGFNNIGGMTATGGVAGTGGESNTGGTGTTARGTGGESSTGGMNATGGVAGMQGAGMGGSSAAHRSKGCGKSAPSMTKGMRQHIPVQISSGTTTIDREYLVDPPANYDSNRAIPLVFVWHGQTWQAEQAQNLGLESNGVEPAVYVYPQGLALYGQSKKDTGWDVSNPDGESIRLFDALVTKLSEEYCIEDKRIFSTGFSFGGYMSNAIGCFRGDVIRAIAPASGGGPFSKQCKGSVPTWLSVGDKDNVLPHGSASSVESRDHWIAANQCGSNTKPVDPSPCVAYQGCQAGYPVIWCEFSGGHSWPNFAPSAINRFFASFK